MSRKLSERIQSFFTYIQLNSEQKKMYVVLTIYIYIYMFKLINTVVFNAWNAFQQRCDGDMFTTLLHQLFYTLSKCLGKFWKWNSFQLLAWYMTSGAQWFVASVFIKFDERQNWTSGKSVSAVLAPFYKEALLWHLQKVAWHGFAVTSRDVPEKKKTNRRLDGSICCTLQQ